MANYRSVVVISGRELLLPGRFRCPSDSDVGSDKGRLESMFAYPLNEQLASVF